MSTLVSSFVQDRASAKQLPTASLISGAAKAWGVINTTSVPASFKTSFACSSLQDMGLGSFQPNFTTAMVSVDYPVHATVGVSIGGTAGGYSIAAAYCSVNCVNTAFQSNDVTGFLSFSVNGVVP